MKAYYQTTNSTYSTRKTYQTHKTYHVKPKAIEEPKKAQPQSEPVVEQRDTTSVDTNNILPQQNRKPEKQLYSARNRQKVRQEAQEQKFQIPSAISCDNEVNEYQDECSAAWQNCDSEVDEKDACLFEDDGRESVSNVSTAMTDSKHDDVITAEILFEMNLATENGVMNVKIYDEEEGDYEVLLDQLCMAQNFDARMGLYFKINMFQLIKERRGQDCKRVNGALNRLLDINYKLIMYESGLGEADQMIAPYVSV